MVKNSFCLSASLYCFSVGELQQSVTSKLCWECIRDSRWSVNFVPKKFSFCTEKCNECENEGGGLSWKLTPTGQKKLPRILLLYSRRKWWKKIYCNCFFWSHTNGRAYIINAFHRFKTTNTILKEKTTTYKKVSCTYTMVFHCLCTLKESWPIFIFLSSFFFRSLFPSLKVRRLCVERIPFIKVEEKRSKEITLVFRKICFMVLPGFIFSPSYKNIGHRVRLCSLVIRFIVEEKNKKSR